MSSNNNNRKKSSNSPFNSKDGNIASNALFKLELERLNELGLKHMDTTSSFDDCMAVSADGTLVSYFIEPIKK